MVFVYVEKARSGAPSVLVLETRQPQFDIRASPCLSPPVGMPLQVNSSSTAGLDPKALFLILATASFGNSESE